MSEKIRQPAVAGQFYDSNETKLEKTIQTCFLDKRGPQNLPEIRSAEKNLIGIVVPHAGFIYSGAIAAHAYYKLAMCGFSDTFIILGPNHTGMGSGVSLMGDGSWETPFGTIPINKKIANHLWGDIIDMEDTAHIYEHSIEVQLPFLQFVAKNKPFDFVPICMGMQDLETSIDVGNTMAEVIRNTESHVVIIASSDFSHAGFNYMSMPPAGKRVDEYAADQDKKAIDKILALDYKGLIRTVHKQNITMCGYGPVAAMMVASKKLGAKKAELLKYGNSYEVHPGNSCVGYGAMAIY
jgi:hypothetical protein